MADNIWRTLRDGSLEGEHAAALTIKDTLASPFGPDVFHHFLSNLASQISNSRSIQTRCLVLVAFDRSPAFYFDLLARRGIGVAPGSRWFFILDCYSDPLGWKERLECKHGSVQASSLMDNVSIVKNIKDVDNLLSMILDLGRGAVEDPKGRFAVAIDLVSVLLRHVRLHSVANLINNIRSEEKVSSVFWLIHADLHEARHSTSLEYLSTMVASLEPNVGLAEGKKTGLENIHFLEENCRGGQFHVRLKRRNGRVKILNEQFHMEQGGIKFATAATLETSVAVPSLLPKVQFNLQLSDKERADREKVVLPFEHQESGKSIHIYDGRQSLPEDKRVQTGDADGKGEIHYFRDSDDEMPDSDEDPDDDLDI